MVQRVSFFSRRDGGVAGVVEEKGGLRGWAKGANTRWRRPIGCLKLQVIFRKRAANYRALLRKMTHKIRHSMILRHPIQITDRHLLTTHTQDTHNRAIPQSHTLPHTHPHINTHAHTYTHTHMHTHTDQNAADTSV